MPYFIYDLRSGWSTLPFSINGKHAFDITPEVCKTSMGFVLYTKAIRKVIFKRPDRYFISMDNTWKEKPCHLETILNLEEGETYYVLLDFNLKGGLFKEIAPSKGEKYVKKAQKSKKFTINKDFIYE